MFCQGLLNQIKANLAIMNIGKGMFTNIRAQGLQTTTTVDGVTTTTKKGVHGGGQIPGTLGSNLSNIDTAYRGLPATLLTPASLVDQSKLPLWVPLLTGTSALVDNGVDFIGFPVTKDLSALTTRSCTAGGEIRTKVVGETTVKYAHFNDTNCRSRGSFAGFGVAVYGDHAPVNFAEDLAPLWDPAPVAVAAVADAVTAVLAALAPSTPNPLTVLTYGLGLAGLVNTGEVLGITDTLPVPVPAVPAIPAIPAIPALP